MAKAMLSKKIITTYEAELEKEKTGESFPRACFGIVISENMYHLAKQLQGKSFDIVGLIENKKLGTDYDLITVAFPRKNISVRRMWLEIIDREDSTQNQ